MKNWCGRHLNWVLIIVTVWWCSGGIFLLMSDDLSGGYLLWGLSAAQIISALVVNGWVLRRKGRSLNWLWFYLAGLGLVAVAVALLTGRHRKPETAQVHS